MKKFIRKIFVPACVVYAVAILFFSFLVFALNGDDGMLSASRTMLAFFFSMILAAANSIFSLKKPRPLSVIFHFVITALGFLLCVLMPAGLEKSETLTGMLIFILIYVCSLLAYMLFSRGFGANEHRSSEEKTKGDK